MLGWLQKAAQRTAASDRNLTQLKCKTHVKLDSPLWFHTELGPEFTWRQCVCVCVCVGFFVCFSNSYVMRCRPVCSGVCVCLSTCPFSWSLLLIPRVHAQASSLWHLPPAAPDSVVLTSKARAPVSLPASLFPLPAWPLANLLPTHHCLLENGVFWCQPGPCTFPLW